VNRRGAGIRRTVSTGSLHYFLARRRVFQAESVSFDRFFEVQKERDAAQQQLVKLEAEVGPEAVSATSAAAVLAAALCAHQQACHIPLQTISNTPALTP
jgi:hypothetical protein